MIKLSDGDLRSLLPQSIADDPAMSAAAAALAPQLRALALAIPNLLIYARLGEEDPAKMLAPLQRLIEARGGLKNPEIELLEALAWQYHVDFREAAKNADQLAAMVRQSIPWHRIKGTPASIQKALALFGLGPVEIEEGGLGRHWASYQLGVGDIPDMDAVRLISRVAFEMQPARCQLWRIHNDYDFRPGVSGADVWGASYWGGYSGVLTPGIPGTDGSDFWVSLGRKLVLASEPWEPRYQFCQTSSTAFTVRRVIAPVWGTSPWAAYYTPNLPFLLGVLLAGYFGEVLRDANGQPHICRTAPAWSVTPRSISRCQGVSADTDHTWGDSNTRWGVTLRALPADDAWWAADSWAQSVGSRQAVVHELFSRGWFAMPMRRPASVAPSVSGGGQWRLIGQRERIVWGDDAWGSPQPRLASISSASHLSSFFAEVAVASRAWAGTAASEPVPFVWAESSYSSPDEPLRQGWGPWPWLSSVGLYRPLPQWSVTPRSISRCQGVSADTDHTWGDLNTCWGAPETVRQSEPAVWGDTSYTEVSSEDVTNRERQSQSLSLTCAPRGGSAPLCGGRCASALAWPSDHVWRGAWQDVPWRQIFSMNFTS